MQNYDVLVNYFGGGMEIITVQAKDRLNAIERAAKMIRQKQRITCNFRAVESMSVQKTDRPA